MDNKLSLSNRSELHNVAEEVEQGEHIKDLVTSMWGIMYNAKPLNGIGLAAPQIGSSKRVIVVDTGSFKTVLINPVITRRRFGKARSVEGCLSYPGKTKKMSRDKQIVVEGFDENWRAVKFKLRGIASFVIQHEIDHLNGVTIGG